MSEKTTYYQRNRDMILNRANNNNKDELREKTKNKCGELSEEKK